MDSPASSSNGQVVTGSDGGRRSKGDKPLKLNSPFGADPIYFQWSTDPKRGCTNDILETIRECFNVVPDMAKYFDRNLLNIDWTSYEQVRNICKKFGKAAINYWRTNYKPGEKVRGEYAAPELLRIICAKAYNRAVDDEKKLNKHYEAFSSQTYGETSYERLRSIIEEIEPKDTDVFVDLGSGVGQLVVQMAGGSKVKRAAGIEIADLPSAFAKKLELEFKSLMRWFGKKYRPFTIHQGDFLDKQFEQLIQDATIIFINNYAFQADLETRIKKDLLSELKEGTRIITTKPYCSPNKSNHVTERQLSDISAMLDVHELKHCPNPCSWTSNDVPYYLHIVNRAKNNRPLDIRRSDTPSTSSKSSGSRESSLAPIRNGVKTENGDVIGPTTRRKWNQYVNELETSKTNSPARSIPKSSKKAESDAAKAAHATVESALAKIKTSPTSLPSTPPPAVNTPESAAKAARAANIADTIDSVADGTASTVKQLSSSSTAPDPNKTTPVAKKRARKEPAADGKTPRGRPRKNNGAPVEKKLRMSLDAKEGIDIMHQLTTDVQSTTKLPDDEQNFVVTEFSSLHRSAVEPEMMELDNRYPNLDAFMTNLKSLFVTFLDSFNTDEFVNVLKTRDAGHTARNDQSVINFKAKIRGHGANPDISYDTLNQAKRYLQRYARCAELAHTLELEINNLEHDSYSLVHNSDLLNESTDSQHVPSTSAAMNDHHMTVLPPRQSVAEKPSVSNVLRGSNLTNGINGTIPSMSETVGSCVPSAADLFTNTNVLQALSDPSTSRARLSSVANSTFNQLIQTSDLFSLMAAKNNERSTSTFIKPSETNGYPAVSAPLSISTEHAPSFSALSSFTGAQFATPSSSQADTSNLFKVVPNVSAPAPVAPAPLQNGVGPSHQAQPQTNGSTTSVPLMNGVSLTTTTTDVAAAPKASPTKKSRSRSARVPANKKNNSKEQDQDPEYNDNIDNEINKIVKLALAVDKNAKTMADNQRKARSSEKRMKDKAAAAAAAAVTAATTSASTSSAASSVLTTTTTPASPKKQKRTSSESVAPTVSTSLPCIAAVAPLPAAPSSSAQVLQAPPPAAPIMAPIPPPMSTASLANSSMATASPSLMQLQPPPQAPSMFALPPNFFPTNATSNLAESLNLEALKTFLSSIGSQPKNANDLLHQMALSAPTYSNNPTPPAPQLNSSHFASLFSGATGTTHPLLASLNQANIDRLSSTPTPSAPQGSNGQY
uniref:Histone-lysine N-methyltransferase, H3 lysine-79 specific n=1 Tax=Panagrellus redivivus TaxID=6233 RepID=A0A7E4VW31_PANRE